MRAKLFLLICTIFAAFINSCCIIFDSFINLIYDKNNAELRYIGRYIFEEK